MLTFGLEEADLTNSPYAHLLDDPDFKRWVDNVKRGSQTYGYEMLRRMGYVERRFKKSPKDFAKMKPDVISVGSITASVKSIDMSLEMI